LNHYEAVTLLVPEFSDKDVQKYVDDLGELLARLGADDIRPARVERRSLAYPVKKRTEGYYVHVHCDAPATLPEAVRTEFKHREGILRLAFVRGPKPENEPEPAAAPAREEPKPAPEPEPTAEPEAVPAEPDAAPAEETERDDG